MLTPNVMYQFFYLLQIGVKLDYTSNIDKVVFDKK